MGKKLFLVALSVAISVGAYAQDVQPPVMLTLEDCLERALGDNYSKQSVQLNESTQEASLKQAKMNRAPGVSANLNESLSNTQATGTGYNGNYDISADFTLYQGGQLNNTVKQNQLQLEQTKLQTQQYDNELTIKVLEAFLTALGNEELLKYQESIVATSLKQVEEGKAQFDAGKMLESDYMLLEAQYADDLNNITETRINLDNSLVALKNLMSMELSARVGLIYPEDESLLAMLELPSRSEVVERGMETLPDVRISEYNVSIAQTGVKISKSGYYPTISLSAGIGTGHVQNYSNFGTQLADRFGPQAGISVSIPIFNRNKTNTNVRQSQIALKQAELEQKQALSDLEQTLVNEYGSVVASASRYKASDIKQNAYKSSFNAYSEMFGAGSITTVELLQQQNNYIGAIKDYIQNKYTFMLQRKVLDVYMGQQIEM